MKQTEASGQGALVKKWRIRILFESPGRDFGQEDSMQNSQQLLVVIPNTDSLRFTDRFLEEMIWEILMGDKSRPGSQNWVAKLATLMLDSIGAARGVAITHRQQIRDAMPILISLLKGIINRNPVAVFPEMRIITDPQHLAGLTSVDDTFFNNMVYVAHPGKPSHFIRMADFHQYLLNEKRGEFVKLAALLGAKEIELVESHGSNKSTEANAGIEGIEHIDANIKTRAKSTIDDKFEISAGFDEPPLGEPEIPTNLRWLRLEPLWEAMALARIERWVTTYKVGFSYTSDFSVNSDLSLKVQKLGLSCGGTFQSFQSIRQEYLVKFFPQSTYPSRQTSR